ncbi:hypothetical protein FXF69_08305 [Actinomadura chibensis]|uniref:Uncharacterized protein n=1 Tax=Actinomadura chibensis TaxID=392828 RepID=A0A5D0NYK7_9ACTN|nr:hypothetical protein FXF69_08305 [Actinomadura chibensis]
MLSPRKAVKKHTGAKLPRTSLPSAAKGPLKKLPQGHCVAAGHRVATPPKPGPATDPVTRVPETVLKDAGKVGGALNRSRLGGLPGVTALPHQRRAEAPLSLPVPNVTSALGGANPGGLLLGSAQSRPEARVARPKPRPKPRSGDVLGQVNGLVNGVGGAAQSAAGAPDLGGVLKRRGHAGRPKSAPLSLPNASGVKVRGLPGVR